MPRIYQRTKNNPYELRTDIFEQMIWIVRGYEKTKEEYYNIIDVRVPVVTGMPRNKAEQRPTEQNVTKLTAEKFREFHAVDDALEQIPRPFKTSVYNRIANDEKYDLSKYDENTWKDYEAEFLFNLAVRLNKVLPLGN